MQELQLNEIIKNQEKRKWATKNSFRFFFLYYFSHYIKSNPAPFQEELKDTLQYDEHLFIEVMAFRGSAKSTIITLAYVIWCIICEKYKCIVLLSDTGRQIKLHIYNVKTELENNEKLIQDFGPFEGNEEWTSTSMVIPNYDTRIEAQSTGQKVRGIRHKQYRPDLMILDDIENLDMIRTKEQRDKVYNWLLGEVIPAGDVNTRYILLGNLLHTDSIMNRIKNEVKIGKRDGVIIEYPFFDKQEVPLWKDKFPTDNDVQKEKGKYDTTTWQREFLLKIVPEEGQVIQPDWMKYYTELPPNEILHQGTGVDLAISKKDTADYTAMVSGKLYELDGIPKIYVMPYPVNERLSGHETTERGKMVSLTLGNNSLTDLWVEDVAYQRMQIEAMERDGLPVSGIKVSTDKRARLKTVSGYIQNGTVLFPEKGCEDLILQLLGFEIEKHDDLLDAFVYMVQGLMNTYSMQPTLTVF